MKPVYSLNQLSVINGDADASDPQLFESEADAIRAMKDTAEESAADAEWSITKEANAYFVHPDDESSYVKLWVSRQDVAPSTEKQG